MVTVTRFGKKLQAPSTFQVKHRFLLWWLKRQEAKEAADVHSKKGSQRAPMHMNAAGP
jgi:hypothetical protein